jgi:sorting nexin-8
MWHELRVVLHNRQNTLVTQALRAFAGEERMFSELVAGNWSALDNALDDMPYE